VFTEHGALQAANILRSDRAIAMNTTCGDAVGWTALVAWWGDRAIGRSRVNVYVIRAFIEQREKLAANVAILKRLAEIDKTLLEHDKALRDIY